MRIACRAKNMRWPVVTEATADAPKLPINLILTIPMIENNKLLSIAGHASSHILNWGLSVGGLSLVKSASDSLVGALLVGAVLVGALLVGRSAKIGVHLATGEVLCLSFV